MLNKILRLERSLVVLDLETTGLNPDIDRVVQIAVTVHYLHRDPVHWSSLINPEIPILNTKNHSIADSDVLACSKCKQADFHHPSEQCQEFTAYPFFRDVAPKLAPRITNVDICGYNVQFDIGFMRAEMKRSQIEWPWDGHIIDPLHIYRMRQGHTLSNAYIRYVDPAGFTGAHDAGNDVRATEAVLLGQLAEYQDLPRTVKELSAFCFPHPENAVDKTWKFVWVGNDCAFNFGKWRGKLLKDPQVKGYIRWMSTLGEFSDEVKDIVRDAILGIYPEKK